MPIFLDVHKIPQLDMTIEEIVNQPKDEFGVSHINIFLNKEADLFYCLLEAPTKEAIEKHHFKINIKCDWITEVTKVK
ncbi:MAG: nickel-binding protein [Nitrososphaeraceae archaeon]